MSRLKADFHPILNDDVVRALEQNQINTVLEFIDADIQKIIKIARLNFKEVLAVRNGLIQKFSPTPLNGFRYFKLNLNNTTIIPTGFQNFDNLLSGGLFTGKIYEICGLPATGKTRFALNLVKNVVQTTNQEIQYLDTKNDFSGLQMQKLLQNLSEAQQMECLNRIFVSRCLTKNDLMNKLWEIKNSFQRNLKLRLIIIDSLPSLLLTTNDTNVNNAFLNHLVNVMRFIATEHYITFLITNLITTFYDAQINDGRENITCGRFWSAVPNTRMKIEKMQNETKLSILKSDNNNIDSVIINFSDK